MNLSLFTIFLLSVDHEITGRSPKIGERAYARSPIFGYSFGFREVLTIGLLLILVWQPM
jgi:hypothetical protein